MTTNRSSEFDVTGTVQVSCPDAVCEAVRDIFAQFYPGQSFVALEQSFDYFSKLFRGELPGYRGCDTVYHDMHHTLDMTLALARLVGGFEKAHEPADQLGFENAVLGVVTALFHDAGYIIHEDDGPGLNGAQFTSVHVTRGAKILAAYLPTVGLQHLVEPAVEIIHFTGYERPPEDIQTKDPKQRIVGQLIATADLIAQMADRCYLEKCRDRLYSEFVLGGLAVYLDDDGDTKVNYESGLDLLKKTPEFFERISKERLEDAYDSVYRYFRDWFEGEDPYHEMLQQNLQFLEKILEHGDWSILKRRPPLLTSDGDKNLEDTQELVQLRLKDIQSAVES